MSSAEKSTVLLPPPGWQAPGFPELQAMLPQYEVLEMLGCGGMGAVYKGRHKSLKRLVAIKILPPGVAVDGMKFEERFQQEAQAMAALNHPSIVSVHDFGRTADGLLYFIMEFVDGTDVQKLIRAKGRLPGESALSITAHVCDALHYAHSRGVIHRDIKPANILIDHEGRVKVADFGLAKMSDPELTGSLTQTNVAMGTPDFIAPEMMRPGVTPDHRADLYAVGVMLYQMLTGEVPRGMFKLPSQKNVGTDPRFDEIICKAMEQDREERYQSALEVRGALDVIFTTALPKNRGTEVEGMNGISRENETADEPARRAEKSSATGLLLIAAAAVAALTVVAFFIFRNDAKPAPQSASAIPSAAGKVVEGSPSAVPLKPASEEWTDCLSFKIWTGWSFEGGVLKSLALTSVNTFGTISDGAVRVRFRNDPGSAQPGTPPLLQIVCRTTVNDRAAAVRGAYHFEINPVTGSSNLTYCSRSRDDGRDLPAESLWKGKTFPMEGGEAELEFRVRGDELSLHSGGTVIGSARDLRLRVGGCSLMASPGMLITKLETTGVSSKLHAAAAVNRLPAGARWQDVTAPMLRDLKQVGCIGERDGVTTEQAIVGTEVLPPATRDAGVRLTYLLRGPESGVMISIRGQKVGDKREHYLADDNGRMLYIAQSPTDATYRILASQPIPQVFSPEAERILEFWVIGDQLTAVLNGAVVATAKHAAYAQGMFAIVLKKGTLLKRVETMALDGMR